MVVVSKHIGFIQTLGTFPREFPHFGQKSWSPSPLETFA